MNNQYICVKNNTTKLYFILGRAELRWNFSTIPQDGSDINRFLTAMCTVRNLWISEPSWGIVEKFQRSSALPDIKYNFVVLFLRQMYWLFIYVSKYFLIDHHCKRYVRIFWSLAKGKIYWCSRRAYCQKFVIRYYICCLLIVIFFSFRIRCG